MKKRVLVILTILIIVLCAAVACNKRKTFAPYGGYTTNTHYQLPSTTFQSNIRPHKTIPTISYEEEVIEETTEKLTTIPYSFDITSIKHNIVDYSEISVFTEETCSIQDSIKEEETTKEETTIEEISIEENISE